MLEELEILIDFVKSKYNFLSEEWEKNELYKKIDQKNILVKDIDTKIMSNIINYRHFINANNFELKLAINMLNLKSEINTRVKAQNSIEYKIDRYKKKDHENGNIPINKCFNDLYGLRIIFDNDIDHKKIEKFIKTKYGTKLKCINASKLDYVATHIYFRNGKYNFQWELQIWDRLHEKSNIISHEYYKQEYTKWEKENKEGSELE